MYVDQYFTGINNANLASDINVYPNPTNGIFQIELKGHVCENLKVIDRQGRVPGFEIVDKGKVYDFSNLSNGIYFIELWSNGCITLIHKIIITH